MPDLETQITELGKRIGTKVALTTSLHEIAEIAGRKPYG